MITRSDGDAIPPTQRMDPVDVAWFNDVMSCTLRAIGREFDVDAFLAMSSLRADGVYHRGEAEGSTRSASGFSVTVSTAAAEGGDLMAEATAFLSAHEDELRRLGSFEGVEEVCLELLTRCRGRGMEVVVFPADLLWRAGALDIDLVVTHLGETGVH